MSNKWNDAIFQEWQVIRKEFNDNKKAKNWTKVIENCSTIIKLDSKAKFIGIMLPIFYKEMANAYEMIDDKSNAINYYRIAKNEFIEFRAKRPLKTPSDWLNDIDKIDRKLSKLSK